MNYIELKRKRKTLLKELKVVEQDICELEEGHALGPFAEWCYSGKECTKCGKRFIELCHYVNCDCNLPHSTDK